MYWADVAHPIMIGLHGDIERNEVIEQVVYDDIDILQQREKQIDYQGCIAINNGDNITVRNMTFRNIRIDDIDEGMLFNFRVCYNRKYCHAPGGGIHNITLENISYNGSHANLSLLTGYNEQRTLGGIRFKNLRINGQHIHGKMPGKPGWYKASDFARIFIGEHVGERYLRIGRPTGSPLPVGFDNDGKGPLPSASAGMALYCCCGVGPRGDSYFTTIFLPPRIYTPGWVGLATRTPCRV